MSEVNLRDKIYFPIFGCCPSEILLATNPEMKFSTADWFLIVEIICANKDENYVAKIYVKDKGGAEFFVAFNFDAENTRMFPFEKLVGGSTLILRGAVVTALCTGAFGIEFGSAKRVKVIPYGLDYLLKINDRVLKARTINNNNHICFSCGNGCKAGRCQGCLFFYFCCQKCWYTGLNYKWHGLECAILQDDDLAALFSGNWQDIEQFSDAALIKK